MLNKQRCYLMPLLTAPYIHLCLCKRVFMCVCWGGVSCVGAETAVVESSIKESIFFLLIPKAGKCQIEGGLPFRHIKETHTHKHTHCSTLHTCHHFCSLWHETWRCGGRHAVLSLHLPRPPLPLIFSETHLCTSIAVRTLVDIMHSLHNNIINHCTRADFSLPQPHF